VGNKRELRFSPFSHSSTDARLVGKKRGAAFLTVQSFFHRREVGGERRGPRFSLFSHSSTDARSVGERRPIHRRVQYAN